MTDSKLTPYTRLKLEHALWVLTVMGETEAAQSLKDMLECRLDDSGLRNTPNDWTYYEYFCETLTSNISWHVAHKTSGVDWGAVYARFKSHVIENYGKEFLIPKPSSDKE